MDTPPAIRGRFYPTHLYARCADFHQCKRCMQCANYNRHSLQCVTCESVKHPQNRCRCSDAQQAAIVQLEKKMGAPMYTPNIDPQNVSVDLMTTSFNDENARLVKALEAKEF